ncbi:uncharacterized protein FIESC28_08425 [Fusarium coffeatum]|uniref:Uncharacterized protein n=1 Tax=Fusarium coffeatum TaxID=231269 RepID=A0A366R714_9HYPO|nr:uncharacterized protein FIESC28_08425 [Fusarium coffeatum]RBR12934.1 hypothetical protein FIESC28_08425 [Fusarium coffeatum]
MAGVIQLGDAIKFAELARTVYELGWSKEHNASENYRDFVADVHTLQTSLEDLEDAVIRAQQSLLNHGAVITDRLGGDRDSLFEIIGDYDATLRECRQLLEDNRRYAETTGPIKNIGWNISVMPQVEHLRGRLQMHSSRIQHILKPFQIDLNRRLRSMHKDIQDVKRTMNSILRNQNADLANQIEHEPVQEELSAEYSQFRDEVILPDPSALTDAMLAFWPEDEPHTTAAPPAPTTQDTCLFQGSLATLSPDISRREIQLLQQSDSEYRFRIVETVESYTPTLTKMPGVFDFDIRSAFLIPLYADPMGRSKAKRPLEIIIEEKKLQRHYVFLRLQDVLAFQAAVTGFKVVDGYMEPRAIAKFIVHGQEPPEDVTIQLWIPKGWTDTDDTMIKTPPSGSQSRSDSISSHQSTTSYSSSLSHKSQRSQHSVTVSLGCSSVGTGYGTIRQPPRSPLLVLFVGPKGPEARRSIVAITLDKWTETQRDKCKCLRFPECPITAIGSSRTLIDARRLVGEKWDLLPLAASRRDAQYPWLGLIRVSIWFPAPELRKRFGGGPCRCPKETEGELELCHMQGHQGLFGVVKDFYRRLLIQYHDETDNLVDVVNGPPYG